VFEQQVPGEFAQALDHDEGPVTGRATGLLAESQWSDGLVLGASL